MRRLILMVLYLASLGVAAESGVPQPRFEALLDEAHLRFAPPGDYVELPPGVTPILDYERALRSADSSLEIRIAVRPLKRLQIDYDDPHGAVPDPNHIFPLVFESLASRLAAGRHTPSREYPPQQAKEKFNADWAAAAVFDVSRDFTTRYQQGLLIAIHLNRVADAYLVLLFDDYAKVKPLLADAMQTLSFVTATETLAQAGPE